MTPPTKRAPLASDPAARRAVFMQAQRLYLQWLDDDAARILLVDHDRTAFNRLAKAARALDAALRSFGPERYADRALLYALLRQQPGGGRIDPSTALGGLDELLGRLAAAGDAGGGNGCHANMQARAWAFVAAGRWLLQIGEPPSAAERGRFWLSLDEFQRDPTARSAKVPVLGREAVKAALTIWRSSGANAGSGEGLAL